MREGCGTPGGRIEGVEIYCCRVVGGIRYFCRGFEDGEGRW